MFELSRRQAILWAVGAMSLMALGCAAQTMERAIQPKDTTWIQRGQTSRDAVVLRFGEPDLMTSVTGEAGFGQYVEYVPRRAPSQTLSTEVEPRPRGATPQVFQPSLEHLQPPPQDAEKRFWILYDERGLVKDFGFGAPRAAQ